MLDPSVIIEQPENLPPEEDVLPVLYRAVGEILGNNCRTLGFIYLAIDFHGNYRD